MPASAPRLRRVPGRLKRRSRAGAMTRRCKSRSRRRRRRSGSARNPGIGIWYRPSHAESNSSESPACSPPKTSATLRPKSSVSSGCAARSGTAAHRSKPCPCSAWAHAAPSAWKCRSSHFSQPQLIARLTDGSFLGPTRCTCCTPNPSDERRTALMLCGSWTPSSTTRRPPSRRPATSRIRAGRRSSSGMSGGKSSGTGDRPDDLLFDTFHRSMEQKRKELSADFADLRRLQLRHSALRSSLKQSAKICEICGSIPFS